jgi:fatty acid-binding protein DegV
MEGFRKGGRLGNKSQYILDKIKIIPILEYTDKIRAKGIRRTVKKALIKTVDRILDAIDNVNNYQFRIIHTYDQGMIDISKKILEEKNIKNIIIEPACGITTIHTGSSTVSISAMPIINKK